MASSKIGRDPNTIDNMLAFNHDFVLKISPTNPDIPEGNNVWHSKNKGCYDSKAHMLQEKFNS